MDFLVRVCAFVERVQTTCYSQETLSLLYSIQFMNRVYHWMNEPIPARVLIIEREKKWSLRTFIVFIFPKLGPTVADKKGDSKRCVRKYEKFTGENLGGKKWSKVSKRIKCWKKAQLFGGMIYISDALGQSTTPQSTTFYHFIFAQTKKIIQNFLSDKKNINNVNDVSNISIVKLYIRVSYERFLHTHDTTYTAGSPRTKWKVETAIQYHMNVSRGCYGKHTQGTNCLRVVVR